jgi:lysophospholipase L1-like esterase
MSLRAVLISLLLCSPVGALPPLEQIVVVGDSIAFGIGSSRPSRAFVARLQQRVNMRVRHYAAPGAAAHSYPPSAQAINFLGGKPHSTDLVVVMLGINDYRNNAPLAAFRDSYAELLNGLDAPNDLGHGKLASFLRRTILELYPRPAP